MPLRYMTPEIRALIDEEIRRHSTHGKREKLAQWLYKAWLSSLSQFARPNMSYFHRRDPNTLANGETPLQVGEVECRTNRNNDWTRFWGWALTLQSYTYPDKLLRSCWSVHLCLPAEDLPELLKSGGIVWSDANKLTTNEPIKFLRDLFPGRGWH